MVEPVLVVQLAVAVLDGAAAVGHDVLVHEPPLQDVDLLLVVVGHRVQLVLIARHHPLHFLDLLIPRVKLKSACCTANAK